jgi:hypothetical protein
MAKRRLASFSVSIPVAFFILLEALPASAADLSGTVRDAITNRPIGGAEVIVELSGDKKGRGFSAADGRFSVTVVPPDDNLVSMTAIVSSSEYAMKSVDIAFQHGAALRMVDVLLDPEWVSNCRASTSHSVVVGYFLPPSPSGIESDLTERVARTMGFDLTILLQQAHLRQDLQPTFEPCPAARPRTPQSGSIFARALSADAFVGGDVAHRASAFRVSTYVSDAYGRLGAFVLAVNESVDLDNPSGTKLAVETHAAILASVAASLVEKNDCVSAISVLTIAKQLVVNIPAYVTQLEDACRNKLPNSGLLRGTP